jgi:hypothetical protein
MFRVCLYVLLSCLVLLSLGCANDRNTVRSEGQQATTLVVDSWAVLDLPSKRKTVFTHAAHEGRQAIKAMADRSASVYRQKLNINPVDLGSVKFSWQTAKLIDHADMAVRESEDAVVRVILSFEGDRSKFSAKNRMLSDLSLALTGEELPYATLMYVWCNKRAVGEVITNPRTDRIRKLVVESGRGNLGKWLDYQRDIRADFIKAFGEEPGALTGIALMTDTDNTQSKATAWYGPVSLKAAKAPAP